ncbi:MAG: diphosphomevalonate decarboxylase [Flavobacteriaceae bacterium]|nr:diphosphomevalonate decarboxylase [Flavobacteriaceae bacterium]
MLKSNNFIFQGQTSHIESGSYSWSAPSNIALIKYWGKKEPQLPANPSISFTLNDCKTETTLFVDKKKTVDDHFSIDVFVDGILSETFKPKILSFFERIITYQPFLKEYHFKIETHNTFPHSSGIASSASGMAALAMCLMSLEQELNPEMTSDYFYKKASFLARLGSGSACRSIESEIVVWGKNKTIKGSSDLYGIPFPYGVHPKFVNFQDTILLVDKSTKQVSSSVGHRLMENHSFAAQRFKQAHQNLEKITQSLISGNLDDFISIVESEALTLHSMMMTSNPYFILMKPNTLQIIQKIWDYRQQTNLPICFTLDAGANVHLLYPEFVKDEILQFIESELITFCENNAYICDKVGMGAYQLTIDN